MFLLFLGTIIVDPILEATDDYKKNVLIAEKRNAVKREFERKAQKANAETQASSTSFSQDCSPSGSENGRKRRHGLSSSENSGNSESLFEGANAQCPCSSNVDSHKMAPKYTKMFLI